MNGFLRVRGCPVESGYVTIECHLTSTLGSQALHLDTRNLIASGAFVANGEVDGCKGVVQGNLGRLLFSFRLNHNVGLAYHEVFVLRCVNICTDVVSQRVFVYACFFKFVLSLQVRIHAYQLHVWLCLVVVLGCSTHRNGSGFRCLTIGDEVERVAHLVEAALARIAINAKLRIVWHDANIVVHGSARSGNSVGGKLQFHLASYLTTVCISSSQFVVHVLRARHGQHQDTCHGKHQLLLSIQKSIHSSFCFCCSVIPL